MKNVQKTKCDGDFAPLRGQNRCVIKFRPIYMCSYKPENAQNMVKLYFLPIGLILSQMLPQYQEMK